MLHAASDKSLRMQTDNHLNHSQQSDSDVKTRRTDLELSTIKLIPQSTGTYYHLLQLQHQPTQSYHQNIKITSSVWQQLKNYSSHLKLQQQKPMSSVSVKYNQNDIRQLKYEWKYREPFKQHNQ